MNTKISTAAAIAAALTFACASAEAAGSFKKETGAGMASGATFGAVVGGPFGAAVGFIVGAVVGDTMGTANAAEKHAKEVTAELADVRLALAQAQVQANAAPMFADLAQRLHTDVMFHTGSAELDAESVAKLEQLGQVLATYSNLHIELHGFADPRGKSAANLVLSQTRAEAVREAIMAGGASASQIKLTAHGADLATVQKDDLEAYAWERRVSIAITPKQIGTVAQAR